MNTKIQSKAINQQLLVPVAKDGTWFGPHLARSGDSYSVGEKGKEFQVKGFANALDILARLPVAKWRRPNEKNHWGIVSAVDKWKKLGDLMKEDNHTSEEVDADLPNIDETPLEETEIGKIYDRIRILYAERKLSSATEGDQLELLVKETLRVTEKASEVEKLCAAAVLGYLSVSPSVKNRQEVVFDPMKTLFQSCPPPLSSLDIEKSKVNSDRRRRAAVALAHTGADWLIEYCVIAAIDEDSQSDKSRFQLIWNALDEIGNLTDLFITLKKKISRLNGMKDPDQRFIRVKKVFEALLSVATVWTGSCGEAPGESLAELFAASHRSASEKAEKEIRYSIADSSQLILCRIIELQFSFAMSTVTYNVIRAIKQNMGVAGWVGYLKYSTAIFNTQKNLLEAMLVLAKQGITDSQFLELLVDSFGHLGTAKSSISTCLDAASELDPDIRDWWEKAGKVTVREKRAKQRDDINVDQQLGLLLLEVEDARQAMKKLDRAVVPYIEISDAILAATVKRSVRGYQEIDRVVRQLGRSRHLETTESKGARNVDYKRIVHDMDGGHKPGIRKVRVLRNGVTKDFGGVVRIIIKERVTPDE